ncbi:sulfotransferase family protein [Maricaulis parjimensis]|uniref:sulfotransferase family protein n=1 Tax=Maricaulis parjimensis TaxID=144023 RepID=UPI00193946E1|nr:sulfotransferase [Maricaulis parjimensis]
MSEAETAEAMKPADTQGARIVFAGGCPRSGLTLLRRMLSPHSKIECGPDTGLPPSIAMQWQAFASQLGDLHARDFDLQAEDMRRAMAELLTGLFDTPLSRFPDHVLIEKTALNVAVFEQLGRLLPEARFIHVVRDGRDVATSLMERDWKDANGTPFPHVSRPDAALKYWSDLVTIGLKAERALPGRVLRVPYEELVRRPKATLTAVCEFLDLDYERTLVHFAGYPIELKGLERDSLPLINKPLTQRRVGSGVDLDALVAPQTRQLLDMLGYGEPETPAERRKRLRKTIRR